MAKESLINGAAPSQLPPQKVGVINGATATDIFGIPREVNPVIGKLPPKAVLRDQISAMADIASGFVGSINNIGPRVSSLLKKVVPEDMIREASDSVHDVIRSNFNHGADLGEAVVPIDTLSGGVRLSDVGEAKRVEELAAKISGEGGYVSRPIVDTYGNVIEGQHRLEALRRLGYTDVPVHLVKDLGAEFDEKALKSVAQAAQKLHPDHAKQIVGRALEAIDESGSPQKALEEFDPPRGFEKAWNAVLTEASQHLSKGK